MRIRFIWLILVAFLSSCEESSKPNLDPNDLPGEQGCEFVQGSQGPNGAVPLQVDPVITGLEVPWAIGFLPNGDYLVTERPGRVRRVSGGALLPAPVLTLNVGESGEGGLMGLAVDPNFSQNHFIYIYYTAATEGAANRLERYTLSADLSRAQLDRVVLADIPSGTFHNGGRLRFGPNGFLYLGTGDARDPGLAQDPSSRAGKILKISPQNGTIENFVIGVRNVQAFDWLNNSTLVIADHGPSGELGLTGRDEVSTASSGANLGWPTITACESASDLVTPFLSWETALPPGGALVYRGNLIPSFSNSILVTSLGSQHLHRIAENGVHEMYLSGATGFGRLREIVAAPDGAVLITTSNCDGRGSCGAEKDMILRVTEILE